MRELTERDRKVLLLAGKICYENLMNEIEFMDLGLSEEEEPEYDRERLRKAEAEAWAEFYRRQRWAKIRKWTLVIACLVLAFGLVLSQGKPLVAYQKLFNKGFAVENETSMSVVSRSTVLVPEDWSGCYVLSEIPKGYKIESAEKSKKIQRIMYTNELGDYIDFSAGVNSYNVNVDTENCVVEDIKVNGVDAKLLTRYKDNVVEYYAISWEKDEVFFDVTSNGLSMETLISVAENVMLAQ